MNNSNKTELKIVSSWKSFSISKRQINRAINEEWIKLCWKRKVVAKRAVNKIRKKIIILGRDKGENKLIKKIKQIHKRVAKIVKRKLILDLESGIFLYLRGIF